MYPVSELYKQKIKKNNRIFECKIRIEHSQGVLEFNDKDLVHGTLTYTEASQAGEEFTIGGTVASDISFTILNKPEYHDITFMGATVFVNIGLQIQEGIDAHFLQPSQPSKMLGFEEKWEYVPLGIFHIDEVKKLRNTIEIKAIDNMINLDKPYSLSKLSYPATLYQIYVNACNVCDIPVGTTSFPNMDYVVNERPQDDLTFRDIIGYVAELAGCFAKCNRNGALELRWYEPTDITLGPQNRFNFKPSDDIIQIKGIMATIDGTTYLAGSDEYAIDLSENPLLQGDYETILPVIYNNVKDTVFTPYTSDWQGNPAIQAGDIIQQIDRDGKVYNTLVTKSVYKYRGRSILEAKGLPELARGYKGSTNRMIAQIKRKVDVEVGDRLTNLEQAQLNAIQFMSNMLGGHFIHDKENGTLYIADNPDITKARKIWKWGIGGFGYSDDGGQTWKTAITADGTIIASMIAAGIITANMIQTGILQSKDGSVHLNLDNNIFNLGNVLTFDGKELKIKTIDDIKNLNTSLAGSVVLIDGTKIRVYHGSTGQYSEMRVDGFIRKYLYGEAAYLNDIYIHATYASGTVYSSKPASVTVRLPERFRGRGDKVKMAVALSSIYLDPIFVNFRGEIVSLEEMMDFTADIVGSNFDLTRPEVYIDAYMTATLRSEDDNWNYAGTPIYRKLGFMLIVIGE